MTSLFVVHRVKANYAIDNMKASIPANRPLCTLLVGVEPVKVDGLVVAPDDVLVTVMSIGWPSPRQLAMLKKVSMLP